MASVNVTLQRQSTTQPWGFRMQGGRDFRMQLSIKKINPNTPAQGRNLNSGDAIISINGRDTRDLTHMEAQALVKQSANTLQLTVIKGQCALPTLPVGMKPGKIKFSPATARGYV